MKKAKEQGFSLIELLLVVVIIGIVAALAIPGFQKARRAAENRTTFAVMRTIASTQVGFFSQKGRFGRLTELQGVLNNSIGITTGDTVVRGRYVFEMGPATRTDTELSNQYVVTATRSTTDDYTIVYELNQSGKITQIQPVGSPEMDN